VIPMRVLVGLCESCSHAETVNNRYGSQFWLCGLSRTEPRFARYPRLPVLRCGGYEPGMPRERRVPLDSDGAPADRDMNPN
jgi:hypothetical protein